MSQQPLLPLSKVKTVPPTPPCPHHHHHHFSFLHFSQTQTNKTSTTTTTIFIIISESFCAREKKSKMCPLRLILVFLSATLAGFFILRNLNSKPDILLQTPPSPTDEQVKPVDDSDSPIISRSTKVLSAIGTGFWTCVDMASGRYLWNHLSSSSSSGKKQS